MSEPVEFEYEAQDNVDAVRTHTGRSSLLVSCAFLAVAVLNLGVNWAYGLPLLEDFLFWLCIALFLLFLVWDRIRDWSIRRNFRQSLPMRTPVRLSWDAEAVIFDTDLSHSRYAWKGFYRWMGSSTSLLLYRDAAFFFPIPRRVLPDGAYEEMVAALRAAGIREKNRRQSAQSSPMSS